MHEIPRIKKLELKLKHRKYQQQKLMMSLIGVDWVLLSRYVLKTEKPFIQILWLWRELLFFIVCLLFIRFYMFGWFVRTVKKLRHIFHLFHSLEITSRLSRFSRLHCWGSVFSFKWLDIINLHEDKYFYLNGTFDFENEIQL